MEGRRDQKLWRKSLDCLGDFKILKVPKVWDTCQGKLLTGSGNNSRERSISVTKLKGVGDLKSALISDTEMQSLEVAQLVFSLFFSVQYFLTTLPFLPFVPHLPFRMVIYILGHYMLAVCDLLVVMLAPLGEIHQRPAHEVSVTSAGSGQLATVASSSGLNYSYWFLVVSACQAGLKLLIHLWCLLQNWSADKEYWVFPQRTIAK